MFKGKKILITGGTGSLGQALTKRLLKSEVDTIRIFSRDEWKQVTMESEFNDNRLRFLIGDVRDKERLSRALQDINIVIHTAALKQVPVAEYNPFEAVKTNVYGAQNLIESCLENNVELALAIGTDKAVSPFNTYGATKLLMERLFITANYYRGRHDIKFSCVRYGNVLGSRGSIVPTLLNQIKTGRKITITDPNMTRFNITMNSALDFVLRALNNRMGGEVFVPKLKAYKVGDIKDAIIELANSNAEVEKISVRPGEKFHESLISINEIRNTFETKEDYLIVDQQTQNLNNVEMKNLKKSELKDRYSSDKVELLTKDELKEILINEKLISAN
ncbi:MAG: Polysaccharide biosynthesis protein CapD (PseB) [Nitrosopumilales archaeon]|nr:MAG: Polysaccharide biosynthesis protein CapD (PseB) [Nitrosopumilales archaeon]